MIQMTDEPHAAEMSWKIIKYLTLMIFLVMSLNNKQQQISRIISSCVG